MIEKVARDIEGVIKTVPGTSSAFAERIIGGYYSRSSPTAPSLPATVS